MISSPLSGSSHHPFAAVPGDLLSTNVDDFRREILPLCEKLCPGTHLRIDLRAARLIDSVGLNQLVSVIKTAKARGAEVELHVGHPTVRRILTFTRIDTHANVIGPHPS